MRLATFFKAIFPVERTGYVSICSQPPGVKGEKSEVWFEEFFEWPKDAVLIEQYIEKHKKTRNMWYCPNLFHKPKRVKQQVKYAPTAWSDLDECSPENLLVEPTITVRSSPGRYQALWLLADEEIDILDAEDISRRIAYAHADQGADKSGWDLTQLLRVPGTNNFKYGTSDVCPTVEIQSYNNNAITLEDLKREYPQVKRFGELVDVPMPELLDYKEVLKVKHQDLPSIVTLLISEKPKTHEWSEDLWRLEVLLFESGLTAQEVFSIASNAACNKYARDGRGPISLWKDVLRAQQHVIFSAEELTQIETHSGPNRLLNDAQLELFKKDRTFIEDYIDWASNLTDASPQYHQAGAFVILSSMLANCVVLPTGNGNMTLNLWFMILGDTTLTRKSTSMRMAMDLLKEVDDNSLLATDGSIEGVFEAMSQRPKQSSIFLRDEFAGMLKGMMSKDYMAGMAESLTKLYDGEPMKRVLRKDTIEVKDPILILYTGGIKDAILSALTLDHMDSGFLPRFCFIVAEVDIKRLRPLGPPTVGDNAKRNKFVKELKKLHSHYNDATQTVTLGGGTPVKQKKLWEAKLTPEAWATYDYFTTSMQNYALNSEQVGVLTAAMSRLANSGLKAATLIAASRTLGEEVVVTELDIIHAFYYVEQWRGWLLEVLSKIGKSPFEKQIDDLVLRVTRNPGIVRGTIMRDMRLSSRQADELISTAEQRMLIKLSRGGRSYKIYPYTYNLGA